MRPCRTLQLCILILLSLSLSAFSSSSNKAPEFTLKDLANNDVELKTLLKKGPVILDFWATWCKPCIMAFPKLEKIQKKYKEQGLTILAINVEGANSQSKIKPFVRNLDLALTVLLDQKMSVMSDYKVSGLPTTILISQDGDIALRLRGYSPMHEATLDKAVQDLLAKAAPQPKTGD